MNQLTLPSPAKLNLFLHICGQRPDGYHLIQTLFQLIDLQDYLHFKVQDEETIQITGTSLPLEQNIIYKAFHLLKQHAAKKVPGIHVHLQKNIPMGGGLGGGSSNAATTMLALNKLWDLGLTQEALLVLGAKLGADVPVFIYGHTAWGEGIGEKLTTAHPSTAYYLVITPDCPVPTPLIYQDPQLTRNTHVSKIEALNEDELMPFCFEKRIRLEFRNDMEKVVCARFPKVKEALLWLKQFGNARLSGSGSSVFAKFAADEQAQAVAAQLPPSLVGRVVKGMNVSTLKSAMAELGSHCS